MISSGLSSADDFLTDWDWMFVQRVISRVLQPARLSDLIRDFNLFDNLKKIIYRNNPHTEKELKEIKLSVILEVSVG